MRRTRIACSAAMSAALLACTSVGPATPFTGQTRYVMSVAARGGYLDATLSGNPPLRFLFPNLGACPEVLKPETAVEYWARGRYGELSNPDPEGHPCAPLGVGSLEVWRNAGPRPMAHGGTAGSPIPRKTARFTEMWRDDAEIFLRGRFPLASWIGFRSEDVVAVVPNSENCRRVIAEGVVTMEYRYNGTPAYAIMMKPPAACSIRAFAIPPPKPKKVKGAEGG